MSFWSSLIGLEKGNERDKDVSLLAALSIPIGDSDSDQDDNPVNNTPPKSPHHPHQDISIDIEAGDGKGNMYCTTRIVDEAYRVRDHRLVPGYITANVSQDTFIQDLLHKDDLHGIDGGKDFEPISNLSNGTDDREEEIDIVAYMQNHNEQLSQILHIAGHSTIKGEDTHEEGEISPVLNHSNSGTSTIRMQRPFRNVNGSHSPSEYRTDRDFFFEQKTIKDFCDESSMVSMEAEELYNQLNELEEATSKLQSIYSSTRNFPLSSENSLFVDVESGGRDIRADFELSTDLNDREVLTLKVFCLPSFVMEEDIVCNLSKLRTPGIDFLPLQFRLVYRGVDPPEDRDPCKIHTDDERHRRAGGGTSSTVTSDEENSVRIAIKPILFNGEYCITLTNSTHPLKLGYYSLYVNAAENIDDPLYAQRDDDMQIQSIQISYHLYPMVTATAISANTLIQDRIAQHHGMKFYRFVLTDPKKYVKFSLKPIVSSTGGVVGSWNTSMQREDQDFDLDMFITNQFDGLVPADKENYRWASFSATNTSCSSLANAKCNKRTVSVIEVLPTDPNLSAALTLHLQQQCDEFNGTKHRDNLDESLFSVEADIDSHIQTFMVGIYCNNIFAHHNDFHLDEDILYRSNAGNERCQQRFYSFEFEVITEDFLPVLNSHSLMNSDLDGINVRDKEFHDLVMENDVSQCVVKMLKDITTTELSYHAIPVNPYYPAHILVSLQISNCKVVPLSKRFKSMDDGIKNLKIQNSIAGSGRLIKCSKMLPMNVPGFDESYTSYRMAAINTMLKSNHNQDSDIAATSSQTFIFVVLYISHAHIFPGPNSYHYRATGSDEVSFYINSNEWKYISNACYFSIYICEFDVPFIDDLLKLKRNPVEDGDFVDYLVKRKGVCYSLSSTLVSRNGDLNTQVQEEKKKLIDLPLLHIWRESLEDCGHTQPSHISNSSSKFTGKLSLYQKIFRTIDGYRLTYRDREGVDFTTYPFEPFCPAYYAKAGASGGAMVLTNLDFSRSTTVLGNHGENQTPQRKLVGSSFASTSIRDDEKTVGKEDNPIEIDDCSLTYSEVEFTSFVSFLHALPAVDGEIFYDLGCGVGKALVASALSGICFLKVVGLEILPSLSTCCADVLQSLQSSAMEMNSSKIHEYMRSPVKGEGQQDIFTPKSSAVKRQSSQKQSYQVSNPTRLFSSPTGGGPAVHEDSLIAWLTNRNQLDGNGTGVLSGAVDDDSASMNSYLTQSTCSYLVTAIPDLRDRLKKAKVKLPIMEVRNENFLENLSWLEADIVFASSLCYSDVVVKEMIEKGQGLKRGARMITSKLSKDYSRWFDLLRTVSINLSCGDVVFHVLIRNDVVTI